jgi:4-amino-4-deoxy-L-arabinose transferase-like glycosyltransferase
MRLLAGSRAFYLCLALLTLVGLGLRLAVLASPLGELDGDEAVVGLMARHIAYLGDRPIFYYNQQYVGSIEAFAAAPLFLLFGSSTFLLKLIPTVASLGFLVLTALTARRLFGNAPAIITAAYLALPPSMWAGWSTKARGGYATLLFMGAAILMVTLVAADRRRVPWLLFLWGVLGGVAFWTHILAVVYIVPGVIYLLARRRRDWTWLELVLAVVGLVVGALPLIVYNLTYDFATVTALLKPADLPFDPLDQLFRFFRVGVPVLAGLGQPTTSAPMFDHDWLTRPAGRLPIALLLLALLGLAVVLQLGSLRRLFGRAIPDRAAAPALLVLLAAIVPPLVAGTRFGFFVSEPRDALPLYSAMVPMVAAAIWRLPRPYAL